MLPGVNPKDKTTVGQSPRAIVGIAAAELVIIVTGAGSVSRSPGQYSRSPAPYYVPARYVPHIGTVPGGVVNKVAVFPVDKN